MKVYKINEQNIQSILNFLGEIPIKYQNLIQGIIDIIKGFEEIIVESNNDLKK